MNHCLFFQLIKTCIKWEIMRNIKKKLKFFERKSFSFRKIFFGSDTEIWPWFWFPIPKPNFGLTLGLKHEFFDCEIILTSTYCEMTLQTRMWHWHYYVCHSAKFSHRNMCFLKYIIFISKIYLHIVQIQDWDFHFFAQ